MTTGEIKDLLEEILVKEIKNCYLCKRSFNQGEEVISSIYLENSREFVNYILCNSCWDNFRKQKNGGNNIVTWHKTYSQPGKSENRSKKISFDVLLDRFKELYSSKDNCPQKIQELLLVLGLILVRKKKLILCSIKQTDDKTSNLLELKCPKTGERFSIIEQINNPIDQETLDNLLEQLQIYSS